MNGKTQQTILVINDVEATRDSTASMLARDGYTVTTAGGEREATRLTKIKSPDLILVSLDNKTAEIIECVRRIRLHTILSENVPAIIFCPDDFAENETACGNNIFLSCPENFNRMRSLISRLLKQSQEAKSYTVENKL